MLAELRLVLETDGQGVKYYQSSNMQGVLMEQIDSTYADKLHGQGLKQRQQQSKNYWMNFIRCRVISI